MKDGYEGIPDKRPGSRIGGDELSLDDAQRATETKEQSLVMSFRVPQHFAQYVRQVAKAHGVSDAEAKRAIFYRGLQAFILDGERYETEHESRPVIVPPKGFK
jgi:hypothetical protein